MARHLDPPDKITKVGRCLYVNAYDDLLRQLRNGEVLVGLYDRYIFKFAVWLESREEYEHFEKQDSLGQCSRVGFFAAPSDVFLKGDDDDNG